MGTIFKALVIFSTLYILFVLVLCWVGSLIDRGWFDKSN